MERDRCVPEIKAGPPAKRQLIAAAAAKARSTYSVTDAIAVQVRNLRQSDSRIHAFACHTGIVVAQ